MAEIDEYLEQADYSLAAARGSMERRGSGSCRNVFGALVDAQRHITQAAARADPSTIREVGKRVDRWHIIAEWFEEECLGDD